MFQNSNLNMAGEVSFEQLRSMLAKKFNYRMQSGRHYVALSLVEAGCLRAAIHNQLGVPFISGRDTTVALRTERTLLDFSAGYQSADSYQNSSAQVCYRFIDSVLGYAPRELNLLVRALQENDCDSRYKFFVEVRSNRRRKQKDPKTTNLVKVFSTADDYHMLNHRLAVGRITALLKSRGMYARDAFAAFDRDRDGLIKYAELQRGLEWLGLKIHPSLVKEFMMTLDKDGDGFISVEEFKDAVGWDDEGDVSGPAPTFNQATLMPPPPQTEGNKVAVRIPEQILANVKIKVKQVTRFNKIWTSQGSMSREKASVWEPIIPSPIRQNRVVVSLGYYCGTNFDNPSNDSADRLALEVTDNTGNWMAGSSWMPLILDRYLPHPARFRLAWSITHGSNPFYAWEPIPPRDGFVALGMAGTTNDNPPDVKCLRCVSKEWVRENPNIKKVWNDSGSGGREGSIWIFNTLNLIGFVSGHDPPKQKPLDLKSQRFFVREFSDVNSSYRAP